VWIHFRGAPRPRHRIDGAVWIRILDTLQSSKALDEDLLDRLARPTSTVRISGEEAQKIGKCLDPGIVKDLAGARKPPRIPSPIVPIATSNGVWIEPALPILKRHAREFPTDRIEFVLSCSTCEGFRVR
jgi:hypothetical protein